MVVRNSVEKTPQPTTNRERFYDELPFHCMCSVDKGELTTKPRIVAKDHPFIQANRKDMRSWMIFDLDHNNPSIWMDANLPPPNMIVQNKNNARCHLYYAIQPVYLGDNARQKPINLLNAVYKRMRKKLNADPAFAHFISKTPYSNWYRTTDIHHEEYSLIELAEYVDFDESTWANRQGRLLKSHNKEGRNCALFDELRYYAYGAVQDFRETGNERGFYHELKNFALSANDFSSSENLTITKPLGEKEVLNIVKSVSKWTFNHYVSGHNSKPIKRGAMQLYKKTIDLSEKQRLSAKRTNSIVSKRSQVAVNEAVWKYITKNGRNKKINLSEIARLANVSRQTVYNHSDVIRQIIEKSKPISIISLASILQNKSVQNAAIQLLPRREFLVLPMELFKKVCFIESYSLSHIGKSECLMRVRIRYYPLVLESLP